MAEHKLPEIIDSEVGRERPGVFADRREAGAVLAGLLRDHLGPDAVLAAIPAGGVPVAVAVAEELDLPLELAVVSKATLPGNTEAGFGAVAYDGTEHLNHDLIARAGLSGPEVAEQLTEARAKVADRVRRLAGGRWPGVAGADPVVVIDDGLASGYTMAAALTALHRQGAERLAVAVPTAHADSVGRLAGLAQRLYCPNLRTGYPFAVAAAYLRWSDVSEAEVVEALQHCVQFAGQDLL
jgi:predicted phosphoribosyltransferase